MPAPQPLQTARVQFITGAAFIAAASIFFLSHVISRVELDALYRTAMFLSAIHHFAALIQQLPELSMNAAIIEKAISSVNLSSLLLSIFFWITKNTFTVQLVPMIVFGLFSCIDIAFKDSEIQENIYWKRYGKRWSDLLTPRRHLLVSISAHLEILTLVLIIVSLLRFKGSLIQLAVFTQYLVVQYTLSPSMKAAILSWDGIVRRLVSDPRCPLAIKTADAFVRDFLSRLASTTAQHVHPPHSK